MEPSDNSALAVGRLNETGWLSDANTGLRARFAPPLGAFPQEAALFELGEDPPLEEKTSAAYGSSQHSTAEGVAVDCQVSTFFAASTWSVWLPGEESRTRHVPVRRFLALAGLFGCVGFSEAGEDAKTREDDL